MVHDTPALKSRAAFTSTLIALASVGIALSTLLIASVVIKVILLIVAALLLGTAGASLAIVIAQVTPRPVNQEPERADDSLRRALSDAIASVDPTLAGRLEHEPDSYLDLIDLTSRSAEEIAQLLQFAVISARQASVSWERIGQQLGMSRQAAQQRFGRVLDSTDVHLSDEKRRLYPLTAFDEMDALDEAGRTGWHSISYGMYFHDVIQSNEQWEHRRVAAFGSSRHRLEDEGWHRIGAMWFPWAYYARPTGKPIEVAGAPADPTA